MNQTPVIFSGIKATGKMHIGNYLGAVKNWVTLQNSGDYQTIYSIVDLHSLTIDIGKEELLANTGDMTIDLLATGIDPKKSILFIQSQVKEHAELAWVFNCILPVSELEKMTQFKDKAKRHKDNVNMGLFDYPALMAADILLYHATAVPIGDDQDQHVELTRKVARKFNNRWGEYFQEPQTILTKIPRLMALNDPAKKMSKDLGPKSYIALSDTPDEIRDKIAKAVTDTGGGKNAVGGKNLIDLFEAFVDDDNIAAKFKGDYKNGQLQYSTFKPMLANVIISALKPIQEKRKELAKNSDYVASVLKEGAEKARTMAEKTMREVREKIGLL
ncbi:MAG: Tryptophan-tRNA ligase [Candidatus Kuenenbacteria bacterium GW2011_GWA2_42_15]|nr:MAG: Tryptophan-tRNA ligase [Candidatus Kuenenbacteria bacterium GW2011_GWA2_42_15]